MAGFNGKWVLQSSENMEAVMRATGMSEDSLAKAKVLEITGDGGLKEEFAYNGSQLDRIVYKRDGSIFSSNSLNVGDSDWKEVDSMDGRKIKVRITIQGDNELTREEKGDGYESVWHRKVSGNEQIVTIKAKGVTATRKYVKE